jgi:hypothetical protein
MDRKNRVAHPIVFFLAAFGIVLLPMLMMGLVIGWADYSVANNPQAAILGLAIPVVVVLWLLALVYMWRVLFVRRPPV